MRNGLQTPLDRRFGKYQYLSTSGFELLSLVGVVWHTFRWFRDEWPRRYGWYCGRSSGRFLPPVGYWSPDEDDRQGRPIAACSVWVVGYYLDLSTLSAVDMKSKFGDSELMEWWMSIFGNMIWIFKSSILVRILVVEDTVLVENFDYLQNDHKFSC